MEYLSYSKENQIGTILLQHAPANALCSPMIKEIDTVLNEIENDTDVKAIVIRGEGRFFSAGADIKEFTTVKDASGFSELGAFGQQVFDRIEQFSKPVIAAIHGAALGGGLELAMACHIRLVTDSAKLGLPELQLGLVPGFAGSQRLPRYVGAAKATEMLLTSEPIIGTDALQWGLANHAVSEEDLLDTAYGLASKAASKSAVAVGLALELVDYARNGEYEQGAKKETEAFGKAFASHDGQEGIKAFIEKRKPDFQDR
ncbi:enoyl-CoA hydratase [Pseudalkalibacillus berkeleyi]|uniref:Enoyl-CoA hydratase n=1 Tax=Pseudalkalibacillus berkeleyi TaxID=1069813 RepID=A0ABS9GZJ1_9BACL|nr:enoyl-CoA hydratase [Pseudalkalibacillus berkeleyi]MCF6138162.1 enoyl-CoA hydratase [Pseudalkalibacillus berkeleyi]